MLVPVSRRTVVPRRQGTGRVTTARGFNVDDTSLQRVLAEVQQNGMQQGHAGTATPGAEGKAAPPQQQVHQGSQQQQQPDQWLGQPRIGAQERPWHLKGTGRVTKRFSFQLDTSQFMAAARQLQEEAHARQQAIAAAALRVLEEQRAQEAEAAQRAYEEEIAQREREVQAAAALLHAAAANLTADQHAAMAAAAAARCSTPQQTSMLQPAATPTAVSQPGVTPAAASQPGVPPITAAQGALTLTPGIPSQSLSQQLLAPSLGSSLQWTPMEGVPERRLPPKTPATRSRTPAAAAAAAAATPGVLAFTPIEGVPEKALGFKRTPPPPKFAFTPVEGVPERLWSQKRVPAKQSAQQANAALDAALAAQAAKVAGVRPAEPGQAPATQAAATAAGMAVGAEADAGSGAGTAAVPFDDDDCGGDEYYGDDGDDGMALELADGSVGGAGADAAGSTGATGGAADGAAADGSVDDADMASAQQHVDSLVQGILESSPHTPSNPLPLNLTSGGRSKDSKAQAPNQQASHQQQAGSGAATSGAAAAGAASVDVPDGSAATVQLPAGQEPMEEDRTEEPLPEEQQVQEQHSGRPPRPSRGAAGTPYEGRMCKKRKSLAADGLATNELGLRRTTRTAHKPLDYWRNESKVFKRDHQSLPTVAGYVTRTPNPVWPHSKEQPQRQKPRTKTRAPHK